MHALTNAMCEGIRREGNKLQVLPAGPMPAQELMNRVDDLVSSLSRVDCTHVMATMQTSLDSLALPLAVWLCDKVFVSLPIDFDNEVLRSSHGYSDLRHLRTESDMSVVTATNEYEYGENVRFVQFSSGSTGEPKGVRHTHDALWSNIVSVLHRLEPSGRQNVVSWLPLSHDMGFVGMYLMALVGLGPNWSDGGSLTLLPPRSFMRRPSDWLSLCSSVDATVTSASPSGIRAALGWLHRRGGSSWSLEALEACIVGAEMIDPSLLREFEYVVGALGARPNSICPAYGCAEMGLAVSLASPRDGWTTQRLDDGLNEVEHVSAGQPLASASVALSPAGRRFGEMRLSGESLMHSYAGESDRCDSFSPGDMGMLCDGDLVPLGRTDQWIRVGSAFVSAVRFEADIDRLGVVRRGCVAVLDLDGQLWVAYEPKRGQDPTDAIKDAFSAYFGIAPSNLVALGRREFPLTHSGKVARASLERLLTATGA